MGAQLHACCWAGCHQPARKECPREEDFKPADPEKASRREAATTAGFSGVEERGEGGTRSEEEEEEEEVKGPGLAEVAFELERQEPQGWTFQEGTLEKPEWQS